ncbi:MAG TPA: hypothetical protein VFA22_01285, partial [Stellaceae bacterium]|nr:hypothetical protein [Stellaceae bacterium]
LSEPRQIDLRAAAGVSIGALELTGDDLHPWASAGEIVIFDRAKFPKQGMGCVMELMDGSYRVGLYERTSNGALTFRVLFPNEHAASVPLTELRGVYAITLRGL